MIGLRPATESDKLHLVTCFSLDMWHAKEKVENWLNSDLTTFFDERGPIFHMAFTPEGKSLRMHSQFDPREKYRTSKGIIDALAKIKELAWHCGYTQLVLWSESPSLVAFMEQLGFEKLGEDYVLKLEEAPCH